MGLFRFPWLRRFVRRSTNPIPLDKAELWKTRLSFAYALLAWNAFGVVCYMFYKGKGDWAKYYGVKSEAEASLPPGQQWTRTLGIKKATVYKIDGLKVSHYDVENEFDENKQLIKQTVTPT